MLNRLNQLVKNGDILESEIEAIAVKCGNKYNRNNWLYGKHAKASEPDIIALIEIRLAANAETIVEPLPVTDAVPVEAIEAVADTDDFTAVSGAVEANDVIAPVVVVADDDIDPCVTFAIFKSTDPLSKMYWLEKGDVRKKAAAQMYKGTAVRDTIPFSRFCDALLKAASNHAFGYGIHAHSFPDKVNIVVKGKEKPEKNIISRSGDFIGYQTEQHGILMVDHDVSEYVGHMPFETLLAALTQICPGIASAARIVRGSVSSGVHLVGESPREGKGYHFYMPVNNAADIPRFGKLLFAHLWLNGYGTIALSRNGSMLVRGPIDDAVFSGERLDFVGKPIITGTGLQYTPPEIDYTEGESLDTSLMTDLTPEQSAQLAALIADAKEEIKPASERKRKVWADEKIEQMVAKGSTPEKAKQIIDQMIAGGFKDLYGDFLLEFNNEIVTVSEVLRNQKKYDGRSLADPIEGAEYGTTTAIFYSNNGEKPQIHSLAHGVSTTYFLHHSKSINASSGELDTREEYEIALEKHVEQFNQDHASVLYGGVNMVCRKSRAKGENGHYALDFVPMSQFKSVYENTLIQVGYNAQGEPVYKSHAIAWHKHFKSASYVGGVCFEPGKNVSPDKFNLWQEFTVEAIQNDAILNVIRYHMLEVVCSGNAELYTYLVNWIAYTFQYPAKPAGAAVVMIGEKGIGKSTLGQFLKALWGSHGLQMTSPGLLTGKHNAHLQNVCFLFADEAFFSGDKAAEGQLKGLITEPSYMVEPKGVNAFEQANYLKIMMATNNTFAVPASRDERRYCVFDVSNKHIGDQSYFNALHESCASKEVQAAFLHWMLRVDLTGWRTSMIPDSQGLRWQRSQSMNTVQKWFSEALTEGNFGIDAYGEYWQTEMNRKELYDRYLVWCEGARTHEFRRLSKTEMSKYLYKIYSKKQHVHGRNERGFNFGALPDAIAKFEAYEKVSIDELIS
ncbi:MAG: DUF5906 domain-containing protein [Methylobacter sp.]|nr:DUF5906 domain-containing protein [Methylobacter sp.]